MHRPRNVLQLCIVVIAIAGCIERGDTTSETTSAETVSGEDGLVTGALCGRAPTYMPGITGDSGYGCFCGPGNSAGMNALPLDPMDSCCKDHDFRWTEIEERYRGQGKSCDCRAVEYEVNLTASDGTAVIIGPSGLPMTTTDPPYPVLLGCNLSCAPVLFQPGTTNDQRECALECCEDARVMSTCMATVPKDIPGIGSIGGGTPGAFEPYDPIFPQPNWGAWNPRFGTDPFHPRGPDPSGNAGRCTATNACGDGKCDYVESSRCSCPADCGFGQGLPVQQPVVIAAAAPGAGMDPLAKQMVEPVAMMQAPPPPMDAGAQDAAAPPAPIDAAAPRDAAPIDAAAPPDAAPPPPAPPRIAPGVPFPGMDPRTNLPVGGIGDAKPYCPAAPDSDGICVRIVSEGRADGPPDPDCPANTPVCTIRSEDLYETADHQWLRVADNKPPQGCGTTGQVFEIGYTCSNPAGFAAAKAWIAAWCVKPPDTIKDPGVRGVCNLDPNSIYNDNTWDVVFNLGTSAADRCVNKCNNAWNQPSILDCQNDPMSRCEWWNSCRAACVAGLGNATMPPDVCGPRPVAVIADGGLSMACSTGTAQANAASVSTYGVGLVTCYDYSNSNWSTMWRSSGQWQTACTNAANLNYPAGANRDEQIRCCMDRMDNRCRLE